MRIWRKKMVQIKDRKNVPSEEDFLKAVEENENQKPKLPKYLTAIYGKIYENPKISRLLDSPRLLNIFTLGNSSRLIEASLKEVKQSQKVLQIGATFGDQIEQTADRIGYYGKYDLIDVSETQLTRVEEKYKYLYANMRFLHHDGREPLTEKYDVVLVYMLLHELPILSKIKVVNNALNSTNENGKVVFIDYYNPVKWHPLRYFVRMFNRLYQPFAEKLWDREIHTFADKKNTFFWRKKTYFGDMYQKTVASRKDDRDFFGENEPE